MLLRAANYLWLVVFACILFGCGYKTNPRPELAKIPGPVAQPDAAVFQDRVVLKWHKPAINTDGSSFDDPSGYKVYRFVQNIGEECEHCDERRTLYANIDIEQPFNATIEADKVTFTDKSVETGKVYMYAVAAYNLRGREGQASRNVPVYVQVPPPEVQGFRAVFSHQGVVLKWDAPSTSAAITGFRIYRGSSGNPAEMTAIGTCAPGETTFTDSNFDKKKTYYYDVRSVKNVKNVSAESIPSGVVSFTVPAIRWSAPRGIAVMSDATAIHIRWNPVEIPGDETRYNIYRSKSGMPFAKISRKPLRAPKYEDRHVTKGVKYRYAVTAYPSKNPADESAKSASEQVEFER